MDKYLLFSSVGLFVLWLGTLIYVYKFKGTEAVKNLIRKAEYIFNWKGAGKEKMEFVLGKVNELLKPPFKWFVTVDTVERLLSTLQAEFKVDDEKRDELLGKVF